MKKNYTKTIALAVLSLFTGFNAFAQPANDDCSGAVLITQASSESACTATTGNTVGATTATYTSACWLTWFDDDVWFQFTATSTQAYLKLSNFEVAGATMGYTFFEGSCTASEFYCGNPLPDGGSALITGLTVGTTYFISTFYQGTTNVGTFDICIYDAPPPPSNDLCSGAINLPVANDEVLCTTTTANTTTATAETFTSAFWTGSYDDGVWYSFSGTSDTMFLKTSNLSVPAGLIGFSILTGDCNNLNEIYVGNKGLSIDTLTGMIAGQTYLMSIFYRGTANRGTFDMCMFSRFPLGIADNTIENSLHVFPNPATDNVSINFNTSKVNSLSVKISDLEGKVIYTKNENNFSGNFKENIDVSKLSKGIYMLQILSDNSITTEKIVIQ